MSLVVQLVRDGGGGQNRVSFVVVDGDSFRSRYVGCCSDYERARAVVALSKLETRIRS